MPSGRSSTARRPSPLAPRGARRVDTYAAIGAPLISTRTATHAIFVDRALAVVELLAASSREQQQVVLGRNLGDDRRPERLLRCRAARRRRLRNIVSVVPRLAATTSSSKATRRGARSLMRSESGHLAHLVIWSIDFH